MLRYVAARILPREAVCKCGRRCTQPVITVKLRDGNARFSGIQTCGSVWMCPVCAGLVAETRRKEVREIAERHARAFPNGAVQMGALTLAHHRFQSAKELRWAVTKAWSRVIAGKSWKLAAARAGCAGWARALEVTHGANGWHPHIHAAFFLRDTAGAEAFGLWLWERWARAVKRLGFGECSPLAWSWERAAHYDAVTDYVVKGNFDRELTRGHMKLGRSGGRSPFQLLADAGEGDREAARLFASFAEAFKGARQVTYSRGLRDDAATDEHAAADAPGEIVGSLPALAYRQLMWRGLGARTLDLVEGEGWGAALEFLRGEGIDVASASRPIEHAA